MNIIKLCLRYERSWNFFFQKNPGLKITRFWLSRKPEWTVGWVIEEKESLARVTNKAFHHYNRKYNKERKYRTVSTPDFQFCTQNWGQKLVFSFMKLSRKKVLMKMKFLIFVFFNPLGFWVNWQVMVLIIINEIIIFLYI